MKKIKDFSITEDAGRRVGWINKRTPLSDIQKQYVEFQIKEAITNAIRLIKKATT